MKKSPALALVIMVVLAFILARIMSRSWGVTAGIVAAAAFFWYMFYKDAFARGLKMDGTIETKNAL